MPAHHHACLVLYPGKQVSGPIRQILHLVPSIWHRLRRIWHHLTMLSTTSSSWPLKQHSILQSVSTILSNTLFVIETSLYILSVQRICPEVSSHKNRTRIFTRISLWLGQSQQSHCRYWKIKEWNISDACTLDTDNKIQFWLRQLQKQVIQNHTIGFINPSSRLRYMRLKYFIL